MPCIDDAHNVICVGFMIAELTMWTVTRNVSSSYLGDHDCGCVFSH